MDYLPVIFVTVILLGSLVLHSVDPMDVRWQAIGYINSSSASGTGAVSHQNGQRTLKLPGHKRHHPHRNRTQSTPQTKVTTSVFSKNFFHHLQVHLGLSLETTARPTRLPDKLHQRSATGSRETPVDGTDELFPMGYPWHQNSHVPFRYRYKYSSYFYAPKAQPEDPTMTVARNIDPCMLARWNYELPFSELPNMAAGLLATDMLSGETTAAKARFMFELLELSLDSYLHLESSAGDVFEIPTGTDLGKCNLKKSEDPLLTSVNHLLKLYTDKSPSTELLSGLVKAAKACLGREDQPFPLELLPCLDFSFGSEQVLKQTVHRSIFYNDDICRKYLNPNILDCVPLEKHACTADHIEALNTFARHFYQCPELPSGVRHGGTDGSADALHFEEDDYSSARDSHHPASGYRQSLTLIVGLSIHAWLVGRY